ncbi:MAG: sulfotransferase domain-containing protein, partial [Alphaproteobacteria bacterium]
MNQQEQRRARSMAEMGPMIGQMFRPEEEAAGLAAYRPRSTDVIITPFSKCGTTWLQQTFHTLRTRGDMDFEDISVVVPWIETAVALGIDIEGPQRGSPRGFKSHLAFDRLPKGARYVVSFREPKDALVSMYKFMEGWLAEPGAIPIKDLAMFWQFNPGQKNDYWRHLLSWWGQRDNPDVLVLSYEYMTAQPRETIERLAAFSGIDLDDELLALTLKHSSIEFMLA